MIADGRGLPQADGHNATRRTTTRARSVKAPPLRGRLGGDLALNDSVCNCRHTGESLLIAIDSYWGRLGDLNPGPTHYEPVRRSPKDTPLLVHTPAYPAMFGHTPAMFRGISGAFCARL